MAAEPSTSLTFAGRHLDAGEAWRRVRRYCSRQGMRVLSDSDLAGTDPSAVCAEDVLAAAVHTRLSSADLAHFLRHRWVLDDWLGGVPLDVKLATVDRSVEATTLAALLPSLQPVRTDGAMLDHLALLPGLAPGVPFSLLTRVLHRKRPWTVPVVGPELLDLYQPVVRQRSARAAWPDLLDRLAADMGANENALAKMCFMLRMELGLGVGWLRIADIAISTHGAPTAGLHRSPRGRSRCLNGR